PKLAERGWSKSDFDGATLRNDAVVHCRDRPSGTPDRLAEVVFHINSPTDIFQRQERAAALHAKFALNSLVEGSVWWKAPHDDTIGAVASRHIFDVVRCQDRNVTLNTVNFVDRDTRGGERAAQIADLKSRLIVTIS